MSIRQTIPRSPLAVIGTNWYSLNLLSTCFSQFGSTGLDRLAHDAYVLFIRGERYRAQGRRKLLQEEVEPEKSAWKIPKKVDFIDC